MLEIIPILTIAVKLIVVMARQSKRQVPEDAIELSRVWNHWLKLQGFDGTKNKVYQHWVEGIADEGK